MFFSTTNLTSPHSQDSAGRKGTLTKATHWWVAVWDEHPALTRCALLWSNPCCRLRLLFQSISKGNSPSLLQDPELNNPSLLQEHYQEGLSPCLCHQWHDVLYSLQTLGLSCTKVLRRQSATNFYMTQRLPNDFVKSGLCHLFLSYESHQTPCSNLASEVETCNNVIYHRNSSFGRKNSTIPFLFIHLRYRLSISCLQCHSSSLYHLSGNIHHCFSQQEHLQKTHLKHQELKSYASSDAWWWTGGTPRPARKNTLDFGSAKVSC